jgi:small subunit ribosomal protein S21
MVPIGRHNFKCRRWFVPRVPSAPELCISVRQWLKKKMQREGVFREMRLRGRYEKPSEKRVREKAEAIRRARKLARKKMQREGLLPMKPRVIPGTPGRGGPARAPRF